MVSLNFGGSSRKDSGTTSIQLPAPSPEETELKKLNLELAKKQIASLDRAEAEQRAQAGQAPSQLRAQVEEKALQNLYARLTGQSPVLNPEEQARLDTIYNTAKVQGETALNQYADQMAGMRGLRQTDTPIGGEVLRQRGQLELGLQGQKAASSLDLSQASADFNARMAEFAGNLRQQAFMNQLSLAGIQPASFGLQQQLFGERLAQGQKSFTGKSNMFGWNTGMEISGQTAGQLMMLGGGGCWLAGVTLGFDTTDFHDARSWLMTHWRGRLADRVRSWYARHGLALSLVAQRHPWLRAVLRPIFTLAARKERSRA